MNDFFVEESFKKKVFEEQEFSHTFISFVVLLRGVGGKMNASIVLRNKCLQS